MEQNKITIKAGQKQTELTEEEFQDLKKGDGKQYRLKKLNENSYQKLDLLKEVV